MGRQKTSMLVGAGLAVVAAVGVAIATRAGSPESASAPRPSASSTPPVRVLIPGRPGESAKVTDSDHVKAPDGSVYNAIDTAFVQMMIVHHGQAVAMAGLAPGRAADAGLLALADRIKAAQGPEIAYLQAWLKARGLPASDPSHDHATMPGMQTPADMTALAGLKGAEFDRKFVTMMTAHHRGALRMAGDVVTGGADDALREVANEMSVEQGSEIGRMADLKVGG